MGKIGELWVEIGTKLDKFNRGMDDVDRAMRKIGKSMASVGRQMTLKLTAPIIALGGISVKAFSDFDKAMVESTAIMGNLSSSTKKNMADLAKTISTQTTFSAKELGQAYFYLASAGMDAGQSMKVLGNVARFAQAGTFDLSTATDLLTDAQSALGLTVKNVTQNQKNLARVGDVLVKANTLANATVQQFSESLTNKAATALRFTNKQVEEGVAVLAAYADQGVKGAHAGDALNIVLRDLQRAAIKNKRAFEEAGVAVYDAQGNMRNMADIIQDLERLMGDMSTEQRKATLGMLGIQERSQSYTITLVGMSEKIREYERQLKKAGGTTKEVADKQLEAFSNRLKILKNRLNLVAVEIGEKLVPVIERLAPKIEAAADRFSRLSEDTKILLIKIAGIVAVVGPALWALGKLFEIAGRLKIVFKALTGPIGAVITLLGILVIKTRQAAKEFKESFALFNKEQLVTGEKTSKLTKIVGGLQAVYSKLFQGLDQNRLAMQAMAKEKEKLTERGEALLDGIGFLNTGIQKLSGWFGTFTGVLSKSQDEISSTGNTVEGTGNKLFELNKEIKEVVGSIWEEAIPAYRNMGRTLDEIGYKAQKTGKEIQRSMDEIALPAARNMTKVMEEAGVEIEKVAEKTRSKWTEASERMRDAWSRELGEMLSGAKSFKDGVTAIWNEMKRIFFDVIAQMITKWIYDFIKKMVTSTADATKEVTNSVKDIAKGVGDVAKGIGNALSGGLATGIGAFAGTLLGNLFSGGMGKATERHIQDVVDATRGILNALLKDYKEEIHIIQNLLREIRLPLYDILTKKLDRVNLNLEEVIANTESLKNIKFGASGLSTTVTRPTLFMAGERGMEDVSIRPRGQFSGQGIPQINISPVVVKHDEGWLIKFIQDKTKKERLFIHPNSVRATK